MSATRTPRIVLIAGSPRRRGNSDLLLDAFEAGAREAGANLTRIVAATAGVEPCRGCQGCSKTGACVIRDGMGAVYQALDAADGLAVATPVYFASVPAVLKALYDRMQPYWARRYVLHEPPVPKRPASLLIVAGGGDPFGHGCAVTVSRSALQVAGFQVPADALFEVVGPDAAGDVSGDVAAIAEARAMGARLVERARNH